MIRVSDAGFGSSLDQAVRLAAEYPGSAWIVGNEPDVIWQDDITPQGFAERYHAAVVALRAADPRAKIGVGAISQVTPLRIEYLDRFVSAYKDSYGDNPPADFWTIHAYVLREEHDSWGVDIPPGFDQTSGQLFQIADHARLDLFEAELRNFRLWMKVNRYQQLPLAVTEFGILMPAEYGFSRTAVASYLKSTFNLLETMTDAKTGMPQDGDRLVQDWAWFSLSYATYPTGNLADLDTQVLTPAGKAFAEFTCANRTQAP